LWEFVSSRNCLSKVFKVLLFFFPFSFLAVLVFELSAYRGNHFTICAKPTALFILVYFSDSVPAFAWGKPQNTRLLSPPPA
jgi:hypothetical protein